MEKKKLIEILLETKALKLGEFTLSSGKKSHYYVDAKSLSLHGVGINVVTRLMADRILEHYPHTTCVGGPELGAIPMLGALLMHLGGVRDVSGFIVRKEVKGHGTKKLIEGPISPSTHPRVVVIEDVCTTGGSVMRAIGHLLREGYDVDGVFCVVDRGEGAADLFRKANVPFHPLLTGDDIFEVRQ